MITVADESSRFDPQQCLFFTIFLFFSFFSFRNPLLLLRIPGIKHLISAGSIAAVAYLTGPKQPYHSDFGMLTLGGVPYQGSDLEKEIVEGRGGRVGMVVSLLQPFEVAGKHLALWGHPIPTQFSFWSSHGVSYYHVPMHDMSIEIANDEALQIVRTMNQCIKNGDRVYLHCQAGRGRSFIICMLYLLVYGLPVSKEHHRLIRNYDEALRIVQKERPQVDATNKRRHKIEEMVAFCRAKDLCVAESVLHAMR